MNSLSVSSCSIKSLSIGSMISCIYKNLRGKYSEFSILFERGVKFLKVRIRIVLDGINKMSQRICYFMMFPNVLNHIRRNRFAVINRDDLVLLFEHLRREKKHFYIEF